MSPHSDLPAIVWDSNEWVEVLSNRYHPGDIVEWAIAVHQFWDSFSAVTR